MVSSWAGGAFVYEHGEVVDITLEAFADNL